MDTKFLENTVVFDAVLKIRNYNSLLRCGDIIRERAKRNRTDKLELVSSKLFTEMNPPILSAIQTIRSIQS